MTLESAHVLITGGSEGIGRAFARRFLAAGAQVLITGRSRVKLDRVVAELPGIKAIVSDIKKAFGASPRAYLKLEKPEQARR